MPSAPATLRVLLPLPVGNGYDYLVPPDCAVQEGSFVEVPFGRKFAIGIVWGKGEGNIPLAKLKAIGQVLPLPPLPPATRAFVDWMADYTLSPPGAVLKMVLGASWRMLGGKDTLDFPLPDPDRFAPQLTVGQAEAAALLRQQVQARAFHATLLDGVTGSGKTEVYAEALAEAFRQGRQALLLLPEIAMTAALIDRLAARFGVRPVEWHSELSAKQRRLAWHGILSGETRFVLGARSALMLPYKDLGVIVVDEEHEASYKQEEGVIYNGRDMAVVRARLEKIPIILASATPSLETVHNVQTGKYGCVTLRERFNQASMPSIKLIDLRQEPMPSQQFISVPLLRALEAKISKGQQAMLFLNRRGYAPLTLCRACGHRLQCPSCSSWLVEHKKTKRLHCHHCDYSTPEPEVCPACFEKGKLAACGPGIERIQEELTARLPNLRTALMASDTLAGPAAAADIVRRMESRDIDVLIGTQLMAKGYHFPRLTLVGVIDADLGLGGGDPRAAERTFQVLQQVAGRSGRAEDPGEVFLQTVAPDHPVMQALLKGDRDAFVATELAERQAYHLPPFGRLASLTLAGPDLNEVLRAAKKLAAAAPQGNGLRLLGPAPAPFAFLRGRHRYRLLLTSDRAAPLSRALRGWLQGVELPRTLKLQIDIDPYSFL